eukprot:scaffold3588_cov67-Phaeocystis_antarctica.AAC.12
MPGGATAVARPLFYWLLCDRLRPVGAHSAAVARLHTERVHGDVLGVVVGQSCCHIPRVLPLVDDTPRRRRPRTDGALVLQHVRATLAQQAVAQPLLPFHPRAPWPTLSSQLRCPRRRKRSFASRVEVLNRTRLRHHLLPHHVLSSRADLRSLASFPPRRRRLFLVRGGAHALHPLDALLAGERGAPLFLLHEEFDVVPRPHIRNAPLVALQQL